MKHEILSWNTFTLVFKFHCMRFSSIRFKEDLVKFNSIIKYVLLIKQKQKKFKKYQNVSEWKYVWKPGATKVHVLTYF